MQKTLLGLLILISVIHRECQGQESDPGPGFQMIMIDNPAFSGSSADGVLRLSYMNYYPGNNYNLHSVYLSYDSYIDAIHGGAGFYISDDYLGGIINDMRGGFSYAYFLKAGRDIYINAGLSASVYHRGFSFERAVLPDQIDPLGGVSLPSAEALAMQGRTVFDVGTGFVVTSGKFIGGISVNHLAEPDISGNGLNDERLMRKLNMNLSGDLDINTSLGLKIRPIVFMGLQGGFLSAGTGLALENNYLSVNVLALSGSEKDLNFQTGFSFASGRVRIFYNYRFNLLSGNSLVPFSLFHQTGLAFSLNNVDKRNIIKTINLPKL